ncbi:replication associated protein [Phaeocystis globosa virus 12T]|uniref:Rep domain protein n=1 Tax=Phaeocystis globosa virus PgV-16T TaxID=3071227 RepID=A0AC59EXL2_9VIRU|nr:Rep domain protein [Phaeocystis globosa virus]AET73220.1 replication associated protein [Phaeocystis globosa virus 12T]AET74043.1 replicase [Phaeocystis globosa virus 14T]AGM15680.1 Rep domain protein [Phaeocystis globosa virus PgV-16T]UYE94410.1 Rep domain protein [Phaeocystis globosa virus]
MNIENSSNSSGEGGNTITPSLSNKTQISPCKRWCFTLNNYTNEQYSSIVLLFNSKATTYVIGDEVGEQGTPHLQGYVEFRDKLRPLNLFEFKGIHWEKAKGNKDANIAYCSKEKVKSSKGIPKPIKTLDTLYPWQAAIEKIALGEPDDRKIYWYWDDDGNIGKSAFIKYMIIKHKILFCSGGKHADIMTLVFNQDMDETSCVMFDIPRANKGHISYASLESIKNGMVCNTKYETGVKVFNPPNLFVFANFPPEDETQLSADRWVITKL